MTENSAFFGARRGWPGRRLSTNGGGSSGLSKTPNRARLGWKRRPSGECFSALARGTRGTTMGGNRSPSGRAWFLGRESWPIPDSLPSVWAPRVMRCVDWSARYAGLQFITTTLRFVEPSSREQLCERYSANEVIPRDVLQRLLRILCMNLPTRIFGAERLKEGPQGTFSRGVGTDIAVVEITTKFKKVNGLDDVRLAA
jgi:hypothetical protein